MRVMLTSFGLETDKIKQHFLDMLGKDVSQTQALFIPTAAMILRDIPGNVEVIDD